MSHLWRGPRHRSWASDTAIIGVLFLAVLVATVLTDWANGPTDGPPTYLTGLLGASGMALFGAAGSDKSKREREIADEQLIARLRATNISDTADRAEAKADKLADLARTEHPEHTELDEPPMTDHGGEGEHQ